MRCRIGDDRIGLIAQQRLGAILRRMRREDRRAAFAPPASAISVEMYEPEPAVQIGPLPSTTKTLGRRTNWCVRACSARGLALQLRDRCRRLALVPRERAEFRRLSKICSNVSSGKSTTGYGNRRSGSVTRACAGMPTTTVGRSATIASASTLLASATRGKRFSSAAHRCMQKPRRVAGPRRSHSNRRQTRAPKRRRAPEPAAPRGGEQQRRECGAIRDARALRYAGGTAATFANAPRHTFAREAGVKPARSRHCMRGAARTSLSLPDGKARAPAAIRESGYRRKRSQHHPPRAKERIAMFPLDCRGRPRLPLALAVSQRRPGNRPRRYERSRPRIGRAHRSHDVRRYRRADRPRRRPHRRRCDRNGPRRQRRSLRRVRRRGDRRHSRQFVATSARARRRPAGRRQAEIDDVDLEQFSVSGIDRIEVVEGGGSTLYGSGSIGGVINIITATPPATQHGDALDRFVQRAESTRSARRIYRFSAPTLPTTTRS